MDYYASKEISTEFYKLTQNKRIEVLYDALDYMQQYNGRTKFMCIAMAMGYENYEGANNTYYKSSKTTKVKVKTNEPN
tara:strand:- start:1600 stop:1833 length:234 start_codon:yes stop_codon:yes gene_type:complete